jgi:hypothetical protein
MEEKIKEIQAFRDAQQKQLDDDTEGWSAIDRINNIHFILQVEGKIKGLDIALKILNRQ